MSYQAVSGLYRNTRQGSHFWFAFRRPGCWVQLDAETRRHGDMHVEVEGVRCGLLIVDGAVALRSEWKGGPGYRRLHAMVQHGMDWPAPPVATERTRWDGRPALRSRWEQENLIGEALFDEATGLVVRTEWPGEVVELTDLRFDGEVPGTVFVPPARMLSGFRGGMAHVQQADASGRCNVGWEPRSGPGSLVVRGPRGVTLAEALAWGRERTDDVRVTTFGPRQ